MMSFVCNVVKGRVVTLLLFFSLSLFSYSETTLNYVAEHCVQIFENKLNIPVSIIDKEMGSSTISDSIKKEKDFSSKVYNLEEFVVTGGLAPKPVKLSPVLTQIIRKGIITNSGIGNFENILMRNMPGLNFQKVGFGTSVEVSGLDARHILFLVDGERLTGEKSANLDYQRFNIHSIERVEIVKGASSTLYGSQAVGAVINIITKRTNKPFSLDVGVRYAQMNEQNYKNPQKDDFYYMYEKIVDKPNLQSWISSGSNLGKVTLQTDILYKSTDGYNLYQAEKDEKHFPANPLIGLMNDTVVKSPIPHAPLGIAGDQSLNISQKIYYNPTANTEFQLYGTLYSMNMFDMIPDLVFEQVHDIMGGMKAYYNFDKYGKISLSIHTDIYDRYKRQEMEDRRAKIYRSQIFQPRLLYQVNFMDKHAITLGVEGFSEKMESDRFTGIPREELEHKNIEDYVVFGQDEFSVDEKLMLVAGTRVSYNSLYGAKSTSKLSLKYNLFENNTIRLNYAGGYRRPSIKEMFFNWSNMGLFTIKGNSRLKPENSHYFSLSEELFNNYFYISANGYINIFNDKIENIWEIRDFDTVLKYINVKSSLLAGVDVVTKLRLNNEMEMNGSYSYVHRKGDYNEVRINSLSPHSANVSIQYNKKTKKYSFTATADLSYTGRKEFFVQDRLTINGIATDAFYKVNLPGYSICNATFANEFHHRYRVVVGVENLFNYRAKTLGAGISMFNVPVTPGRRFHITSSIFF